MHMAELHYFLAVVEAGSFGKAAHLLELHVSTLSRAISRLEDRLGVTLVERTTTGIRPTASGRVAAHHIRRVLNEASALSEILGRRVTDEIGEIHLGFHLPPVNSVLSNLLLEWHRIYPSILITPHEPCEGTLLAALVDRQIDVALIPDFLADHFETASPIYSESLMAVLPETHRLAERVTLRWNDLENEKIFLWAWGKNGIGQRFFSTRLPSANPQILDTGNLTMLAFIRAGYGITIAMQAYSCLNFPGLKFIPINEDNASITINLVWRPASEDPIVGKFVAFMRDRVKAHRQLVASHVVAETPGHPP
ncbi:LysR family transcriptional regulator [Gluconacetobacter sp. 1b LMG 1731]|uniref:LysR family transcriptional regulator n=1 Tax=Gluconacetobacter dulcium TaxID=2729096 RepID=A0A7W4ILU0_9PROT|nr:LysR family transcriptional regulator [Gluconacetobacter dulcium]MBB2165218.1 LysR family transcriptional regulator [Gluconacetobacter dulcium]MBB2194373.1 LysR family transcriptional regulator [Gluconacetobacter dulcium]